MRPRGSITGPLLLIGVGIVFLIHAISPNFPIADFIAQYWPFLLIAWGVIQLIEITIRFLAGGPIPANGISGAGWALVVLISIVGLATFEVRRPDNWWRRAGFERGVEAFGEGHAYSIDPIQKAVGKTPHLVIETFRGDAKIVGTGRTDLVVSGHKVIRAFEAPDADRANSQTPVQVLVEGNTVIIRCNQDKAGVHTPVTTDLEVAVPKGASIEATGTVGDFDISSVSGDLDLSSGNAGMHLQDIDGNAKIDTRKSDVIRCANIKGSVNLRGRGTDVELTRIAGQVIVSGEYSGTVSLRDCVKPVRLESMRTDLYVQQVPGEIRLDRGSLNLQNVVGPVKLTTRSTDVTVSSFSNGLELTVDKGDIELKPERLPLSKMAVHTRSGNIELALPQTAKFALTASTDHGEIDNQFGEALKERSEGRGARLEGSIGDGPDVNLVTDRGSITVRKAAPGEAAPAKVSNPQRPQLKMAEAMSTALVPHPSTGITSVIL
jgi:DUF4097 and DUF4098 domain-containing protein YvlB